MLADLCNRSSFGSVEAFGARADILSATRLVVQMESLKVVREMDAALKEEDWLDPVWCSSERPVWDDAEVALISERARNVPMQRICLTQTHDLDGRFVSI